MSDERIRATGLALPPETLPVLQFYRRYGPQAQTRGEAQLWRDPEEFIDQVESANAPGGIRSLFEDMLPTVPVATIADVAKRALAVDCSIFLRGADPTTEKWLPYRLWASRLNDSHTIISFNYDRVLETLQENAYKFDPPVVNLAIVPPDSQSTAGVGSIRTMGGAPVLKLHGSVGWCVANGKVTVDPADDLPARCSGDELVLAVPGPNKTGIRKQFKELGRLWTAALASIGEAARIVFVGYRFPATDAFARVEILGKIKQAVARESLKRVEIVLGPDVNHPDVARMLKLLEFVCPKVNVQVLPLNAEDLLSLSHLT